MGRFRFLGESLDTRAKARRGVREFAELVGAVINATVSPAPITYAHVKGTQTWFIGHVRKSFAAPMPLNNGAYLFLYNRLGLRREEQYLATLEYRYVYQAREDDASWIFRYEYVREPPEPYPYARQHVHVNASPADYTGDEPFPGLHLPTGRRITIELLVRHLIAEHGITPISTHWEERVREAEAHFREIQQRRFASKAYPVSDPGEEGA